MPKTVITTNNVTINENGRLNMEFMLDPQGEVSKSGASMVVASTEGFIQVDAYRVSVNVIKKRR